LLTGERQLVSSFPQPLEAVRNIARATRQGQRFSWVEDVLAGEAVDGNTGGAKELLASHPLQPPDFASLRRNGRRDCLTVNILKREREPTSIMAAKRRISGVALDLSAYEIIVFSRLCGSEGGIPRQEDFYGERNSGAFGLSNAQL
jgi:hypothetical protein